LIGFDDVIASRQGNSQGVRGSRYFRELSDTEGARCADFPEAIEDYKARVERDYLMMDGLRDDALTEPLEPVHRRFDEVAAMIAVPPLERGASKPFDRMKRFIAGLHAPGHALSTAARCGGPEGW
jgi:hypothetical protein